MSYSQTTHAQKFMRFTRGKETAKLIEIWGEQVIQEQLEGCEHNCEVYDKI